MEQSFFACARLDDDNALADIGTFYTHDDQSLGAELGDLVGFLPAQQLENDININSNFYALKVEVAFIGWKGDDLMIMGHVDDRNAPSVDDNIMITDVPFQRNGEFQIHEMFRQAAINLLQREIHISMEVGEAGTFSDRLPLDKATILGEAPLYAVGTYADDDREGRVLTLLYFMELPNAVCGARAHLNLWESAPRCQLLPFEVLTDLPPTSSPVLGAFHHWFTSMHGDTMDFGTWWMNESQRQTQQLVNPDDEAQDPGPAPDVSPE